MFKVILHLTGYGLKEYMNFGLCKSYSFKNIREGYLDEFAKTAAWYEKVVQKRVYNIITSWGIWNFQFACKNINQILKLKITIGSDTRYWIKDILINSLRCTGLPSLKLGARNAYQIFITVMMMDDSITKYTYFYIYVVILNNSK